LYNYISKNKVKILLIPLILYWIILFIGTSLPANSISNVFEISDKIKHFAAYLILAFLLSLNLHFQGKWNKIAANYLILTFIICTTYGVLDELHQIFIPNRFAEFYDWLADLLGSIIGVFFGYVFIRLIKNTKSSLETN